MTNKKKKKKKKKGQLLAKTERTKNSDHRCPESNGMPINVFAASM
jgi:hypothetical protein